MARHLIALAAMGLVLTGCVAQERYRAVVLEKEALVEQLNQAQASESAARAAADAWKNQLDRLIETGNDKEKLAATLMKENGDLKTENELLKQKYADALSKQGQMVLNISPELNKALQDFAAGSDGIATYDPGSGTVKFKSDVTFAKGSAELTPTAKQVIDRFASILNSPAAANYELLVAGHTDSTPVSNPATISAGHKDNWYLSAHRAISVGRELMREQVSARRLGCVGYGAERPVASNLTSEGQTRNRRVEVVILPTTVRNTIAKTTGTPVAPRRNTTDLNKDSVQAPPSIGAIDNK